jgi:AcrR family transcriptional regulator
VRALPGKASRQPPGPEPVSRAEAAADQRRRILEATADLVAEQGYANATIEQIVRRAKVGYATFYKHFADKDEAFLALLDAAIERTLYAVEEAYDREGGPWPDKVGAGLGALLEQIAAHPNVARACLVEAPTAGPEPAARHEAALKRFVPLLRPGRELNPRQAELPATLEDTLAGGVLWVVNQRLIAGEESELRALLPEALEFLLRPYVGEEEAAREAGAASEATA